MKAQEIVAFSRLFLELWGHYRLKPDVPGMQYRDLQKLENTFRPISSREHLSQMLPSDGKPQACWTDAFVFLEPPPKGDPLLPVVSLSCDFGPSDRCLSLRIALFRLVKEGSSDDTSAVGLRFETPEDGQGAHSYCHAQFITGFHKDDRRLESYLPSWMPEKQPAIPVDAFCPVSLLLAVFISLYGLKEVGGTFDLIVSQMQSPPRVAQYKNGMHCLRDMAKPGSRNTPG